jgi:hypothetical protein
MSSAWNILVGLLVTVITFLFSQWSIKGKYEPIGTALKGVMAIVVAFILSVVQGLVTGEVVWNTVWASLPAIVGWAMGFYGVIIKPIDKAVEAAKATKPTTDDYINPKTS